MQKMVLKDKTEMEILAGASIGNVTIVVNDFATLGTVAQALTKAGNLDSVQFKQEEQVIGTYTDLKLAGFTFYKRRPDRRKKCGQLSL